MVGALSPVISTSLLISGDRRGLDIEFSCVSNDSICTETSVKKKLDTEAQWIFLVDEHMDVPGG